MEDENTSQHSNKVTTNRNKEGKGGKRNKFVVANQENDFHYLVASKPKPKPRHVRTVQKTNNLTEYTAEHAAII